MNEFIAKEEMIILAVAPATEDLHNAEAIALARKARCWCSDICALLLRCCFVGSAAIERSSASAAFR